MLHKPMYLDVSNSTRSNSLNNNFRSPFLLLMLLLGLTQCLDNIHLSLSPDATEDLGLFSSNCCKFFIIYYLVLTIEKETKIYTQGIHFPQFSGKNVIVQNPDMFQTC